MKKLITLIAMLILSASVFAEWSGINRPDGSWVLHNSGTNVDGITVSASGVQSLTDLTLSAVPSVDHGTTVNLGEYAGTNPINTAGTQTLNFLTLDVASSNSTGGTNVLVGLQIDALAGADAQVTETAINIGTGWDVGIQTAGSIVMDDGTTDAPSLTMQDATNETVVFTKLDAGFLTVTTVAGDGLNVLVGNLKIGNGSPTTTMDGEDAYIEGTLEVDGEITLGTVVLDEEPLKFPGRASFTVCGDLNTINSNTVYYGPNLAVVSSATVGLQRLCNMTEAGNTTEATADTPAFTAQAFYVLSMDCNHVDTTETVTFTARSAAADLTPTLVVTTTTGQIQGMAEAVSTTAVASGATFAVAAASGAAIGAAAFACTIHVAY